MKKLAIVLMKAPYGDINAAEAIRHSLGAVGEELNVSLILVDGGALIAIKGQDEGDTEFTNLGNALKDCIDMDINVYAESSSLRDKHLEDSDIIEGIKIISASRVSQLVKEADKTMIF